METTTTHRFVLRFSTDSGRILRISIPRACLDKSAAEAEETMDAMLVNSGVLASTTRGTASGVYGAERVTTVSRPIV
ncbi:MAG: DUF2922 domain-containing protein [Defluviitaleaceae bacterium]|nr:DUF2922 domain-containing protein [Defluviitaleaceae bacterium]